MPGRRFPPPWTLDEAKARRIAAKCGKAVGAGRAALSAIPLGLYGSTAIVVRCTPMVITGWPMSLGHLHSGNREVDGDWYMSHRKHPSKRKLAPALGAAGLSLSLAGGVSAASAAPTADIQTQNTKLSHEITLYEEEISDVSLATFYVFDNENAGTFRRRIKLAQGCGGCGCGGGGCGGGGGGGCASCASSYSGAVPFGSYVTPPRYSKPHHRRR